MTQEELYKKCIKEYYSKLPLYKKMDNYYRGNTDAILNYTIVKSRANNKIPLNYLKKFIKEEVGYILNNKITYLSKTSNEDIINQINTNIAHWSEQHDQNILKNALKFGYCYELYYLDSDGKFCAKALSPLNAYAFTDDSGSIQFFMHFFSKKFSDDKFMDLYLPYTIKHYKINNNNLDLLGEDKHIFGQVPVSICEISEEREDDTLFKDLKGLQDALEINLSDISNEISDFRNAYLCLLGCDIEDEELEKAKVQGAFKLPNGDKVDIKWLIKNINDAFIQNTLKSLKENMYEIANHINSNEKLQSNTSSLALRTRLIALEQKCKDNSKAVTDCIKNRLKFLFEYIRIKTGKTYNYLDVKIKFTPSIPQDDLMMAQILSQAGDKISTETGIAQFSFIDNPKEEMERIKREQEEKMIDLDKVIDNDLGDE